MTIDDEVAAAMKWAREHHKRTPEQWARELTRLVGGEVTAGAVIEMEAGALMVPAAVLVAAARLVEQPVSVLLGEMDMYEVTIPALERRISELEVQVERAGLR